VSIAEVGDAIVADEGDFDLTVDDLTETKTDVVEAPKMSLEEAVRALIHEPRDHWMGSIKVRAGLMGLNVHQYYPTERWKEVFIAWGGHGVLK